MSVSIAYQCPPLMLDPVRRRFRHVARARIVFVAKKFTSSRISALPVSRHTIHDGSESKGHVGWILNEAGELVLAIDGPPIGHRWVLSLGHGQSRRAETLRQNEVAAIFVADNSSGVRRVQWTR